jgi:PAS domain S-box-containing protein
LKNGIDLPPLRGCGEQVVEAWESSRLVEVLTEVIDTAIELTGADFGNIQLLDDEGSLRMVAQRHFPDWWLACRKVVSKGQCSCGTALVRGERVIVEDVEFSPIYVGTPALDIQRRAGIRAVQSTPLRNRGGKWIGMLSTHYRVPCRPDLKTLKVLDLMANHTVTLIEQATTLEQTRNMLVEAQKIAHMGSFEYLADTQETVWSEEEARIFGIDPAEPAPTYEVLLQKFFHPGDVDRLNDAFTRAVQSRSVFELEHRIVRPDGSIRWVYSRAHPYLDERGVLVRYVGTTLDITERKEAEEALFESRHLLELALAGTELGMWDVEMPGGKSTYDDRYCAMFGYQADEIEPTMEGWLRQVHPDDLRNVEEAMRAHLAGESRIYEAEYRQRHKDGHWVWVFSRGKVTYDAANQPVRATGTTLDISDRKRVTTVGAELLKKFETLIAGLDRHSTNTGNGGSTSVPRSKTRLSGRNREVLQLIAEGMTSTQIAKELGISEGTAATHRRNLMHKLGLKNKAELVRYAIKHGIVAA